MRPTHFNSRHRPVRKSRNGEGSWNRPGGNGRAQTSKANLHRNLEKYLSSAREATRNGDKIAAEGFYQHAEHYQRLINRSQDGRNAEATEDRMGGRDQQREPAETTESEGRRVSKEDEIGLPPAAGPRRPQPPPTDF